MMSESRIGRVLVASLHQAIADLLPTRLEFYENWLNVAGLREGRLHRAVEDRLAKEGRGDDRGAGQAEPGHPGGHAGGELRAAGPPDRAAEDDKAGVEDDDISRFGRISSRVVFNSCDKPELPIAISTMSIPV